MTNTLPQGPSGPGSTPYSSTSNPRSFLMPRRSSYASVLSGSAATNQYTPPMRSGAFSHLLHSQSPVPPGGFLGHRASPPQQSRQVSREMDHVWTLGGSPSAPGSWGKGAYSLPGGIHSGFGTGAYNFLGPDAESNEFFTPSYLRNSRYVERLAEAHKAKLAAQKESNTSLSNNGSLSTSSSSANLHKMAPSHRGMTYDIIEKEPIKEDVLNPLPSKWNDNDKFAGLELQADRLEVRFTGPSKSHDEAAAVRADRPMPPECGIYYYEVTVISKGKEGLIGVGFSGPNVSLNRLPGWEPESWAYHGDDGFSFSCTASGKAYGPKFSTSDVIGCGVNFRTGCAFFTKNGVYLGVAFRDLKGAKLFPSVGMKRPGEHLRVNFGQTPFVFDIDGMMAEERQMVRREINATSATKLHPPLDETSLIQALVAQFLAHDGYVETAKAFAEEVREESKALQSGKTAPGPNLEAEEDLDAVNRQRIRAAILDGDIDTALKHTNAYYPNVLKDNEQIYFRLRCRKFVEMIRQCSDLHLGPEDKHQSSNGRSDGAYVDVFDQQMELDDQNGPEDWSKMDTEDSDVGLRYQHLLQETLHYGQELQLEFREDGRKEIKKALEETFSLLAYEDPRTSVVAHLLDPSGRIPVAEELNSAILVSLGKSSSAALEKLCQQTEALINEISDDGGAGAFINMANDFLR
ncbi:SPRY domain-containing protein [Xylona heveae TC161]|uniref:SPRY domain-containing protein n=1 Tax=Xylona heveae (strain CBS 132557 / TC161) TaxID=1328760 RepID=A0A161TEE8_XYLHT|nr:SPRY domain-containing protein [Xylona heveae TC161]KZF24307.1 SPRY domain-containing protein [Xylona heveae TC161]